MKNCFYILFLISAYSCQEPLEPQSLDIDKDIIELNLVLKGELNTPTGFLKSKIDYYQYTVEEHYYYNSSGEQVLTIELNEKRDTVGYAINYFDDENKIILSKNYHHRKEGPIFFNSTNYSYNTEGKLTAVSKGLPENFKVINKYFYDAQGRMIEINGPIDGGGEKLLLFYESSGSEKIVEEHFFWDINISKPYFIYTLNYDLENRVVSKTTTLFTGKQTGFEYSYASDGKLLEEKEYDLHFGQQMVRRIVYEYY